MTTQEYLDKKYRIGFTQSFPVKRILASMNAKSYCRKFLVEFQVHIAEFTFGNNNEFSIYGIITDQVDISKHLFLDGFGSMCLYDEARVMKVAAAKLASMYNLPICEDICSWPYAKVLLGINKQTAERCVIKQ